MSGEHLSYLFGLLQIFDNLRVSSGPEEWMARLPLLASARCGSSPNEKRTRRKSGWTLYLCKIPHMRSEDIWSGSIVRSEYMELGLMLDPFFAQ
jgi:hypothetical protein